MMDDLEKYLQDVVADMDATRSQFETFLRPDVKTHPIPYFGDIKRARVLTVGMNPSAGEFVGRGWPEKMEVGVLKERLQRYFEPGPVPQHKWFEIWRRALILLEVSYQDSAAHIDLSPRATVSRIKGNANRELFATMIARDAQWFFNLLPECTEASLLLFAGRVMNEPVAEFVGRSAPKHGFRLESQATAGGQDKTEIYWLRGPGIELPAFFCSVSPSSWNPPPETLIHRIYDHKEELRELIGPRFDAAANNP